MYFQRQDPASWGDDVVAAMRSVTEIRYRLLPYLYTLFYRAHAYNEMVAIPLGFVYAVCLHVNEIRKLQMVEISTSSVSYDSTLSDVTILNFLNACLKLLNLIILSLTSSA